MTADVIFMALFVLQLDEWKPFNLLAAARILQNVVLKLYLSELWNIEAEDSLSLNIWANKSWLHDYCEKRSGKCLCLHMILLIILSTQLMPFQNIIWESFCVFFVLFCALMYFCIPFWWDLVIKTCRTDSNGQDWTHKLCIFHPVSSKGEEVGRCQSLLFGDQLWNLRKCQEDVPREAGH